LKASALPDFNARSQTRRRPNMSFDTELTLSGPLIGFTYNF
jgi:hypothetical protein